MMVHVTAPATLPAGYTFEAEINGDPAKLFTCEVVRIYIYIYINANEGIYVYCIFYISIFHTRESQTFFLCNSLHWNK
jgi:hypothetical protein